MTDVTRRILLGGVFASLAIPALARDDDMRPVAGPRRTRPIYRHRSAFGRNTPRLRDDQPSLEYQHDNAIVKAAAPDQRRVVMMGDSITRAWQRRMRPFFRQHGLLGRGIGGETAGNMLARFASDVIDLEPKVVHIMAGTNDLVAERSRYDAERTRNNIEAMATRAKERDVAVILASVPPLGGFDKTVHDQLRALNEWISTFCSTNGHTYSDYWPVLRGANDRLKASYSPDGIHLRDAAYEAMRPTLLASIDSALTKKPG